MYCFNSTSNPTIHCSRASHVSITPLPSMPPAPPSSPLSSRLKGGRVAVEPRPQCGSRPIYLRIRKPVSDRRELNTGHQHFPTLANTGQHWAAAWCISSASAHHSLPHTCYLTTSQPTYQPILFRLEFKSIFYRQHWQPITNTQKQLKARHYWATTSTCDGT